MKTKLSTLLNILIIAIVSMSAISMPVSSVDQKTSAKPSRVKLKSVKVVSKNVIWVKWKKVKKAKGYQIKISKNKKFTKARKINVKKNACTKKIKKLKAGTKYYVKVRAFSKSKGKKVYGKWSKTLSVRTKPVLLHKELTESDLKSIIEKKSGKKIAEWKYEDFDGNGTKEAFAVIGSQKYVENKKAFVYIWFINSKGETTQMMNKLNESFSYCSYYSNVEVFEQGKKCFFSFTSSNEAPSIGFIFEVVNGKPHEFDVSGKYFRFTYENDKIYANSNTTNESGLVSVKYEMTYDEITNEFIV